MAMKVFTGGNKKKFQMTTNFFPSNHKKFLVVRLMEEIEHRLSNN
jgi:hypothetical protein